MSDWTSLNAIMRDLSVAQGSNVPASLEIFGNGPPQTASYEEETEAEYYKSYDNFDYSKPPDFRLIKEMLDRVKRETEKSNDDNDDDDILFKSNLNPLSSTFQPGKRHRTQSEMKKKRERNVAIESILQSLEISTTERHCEISKSPMSMFKSKRKAENRCVIDSPPAPQPIVNQVKSYVPTILADIYYNKYKENAKLKEEIKENIWAKVEQQMKKNEDRKSWRLKEEKKSSSKGTQNSSEEVSETNSSIYKVTLEQYRHLLLDSNQDCVVCNVAAKHGYHFEKEEC